MKKMTEKSIEDAFAGESMAHMKYLIFAEKSEVEGKPKIARLFRAIAHAEFVHAKNHFKVLGKLGKTSNNLGTAIDGENFEVDEMYPVYDATAKLQGEKEAEKSIHYAIEAEKIHAEMYSRAKKHAESDQDIKLGDIYICPVCGYTVEDKTPDFCPVCSAKGSVFKKF